MKVLLPGPIEDGRDVKAAKQAPFVMLWLRLFLHAMVARDAAERPRSDERDVIGSGLGTLCFPAVSEVCAVDWATQDHVSNIFANGVY